MGQIGWRVFTLDDDAVLTAPLRRYEPPNRRPTDPMRRYPTVHCIAECEAGHPAPDPNCGCGLYYVDRYAEASGEIALCTYPFAGPRVYARVEVTPPVMGDAELYRYLLAVFWPHKSLRAAELRITELWVPGPDHCATCARESPGLRVRTTPLLPEEILTALAARYDVPVRRLAPHRTGQPTTADSRV